MVVGVAFCFALAVQIVRGEADVSTLKVYFLDVGQGDAELAVLPGGVKVLIDGGPPNGKVLDALGNALKATDRYIDLVVLSHAELDHFGGLIEVLKRYRVGAFLWNGRAGTAPAFADFKNILDETSVQVVELGASDSILYNNSSLAVLSPDKKTLQKSVVNDTALVLKLSSNNARMLFTGDIGADEEQNLAASIGSVHVLKVAHHGSKFSTTANFLDAVSPKYAVIEVGKNTYGHPTPDVLQRLADSGARVFRTDKDGILEFVSDGKMLRVVRL
jgi:beta-lactamase superfamily II metal-dependent hydrolase